MRGHYGAEGSFTEQEGSLVEQEGILVEQDGEVRKERRRNARAGETEDPRETTPINAIVRHDSRLLKSGSDPAGDRTRSALVGGEQSNRSATRDMREKLKLERWGKDVVRGLGGGILQPNGYRDVNVISANATPVCCRHNGRKSLPVWIKLNTMSAYTRQKAKSKYRNCIRLERASQKQSSDTHKTPYDRVKRCLERKKSQAPERVNVDVFTEKKRPCPQHSLTNFFRPIPRK
ncbi:hypothetical protein PR048_021239 [Dryococelus australis]|uniref:Uncharacterized protein n=1 Tax=Dryococelus australis TaxID=614101 RepID=A0ABQ9GXP8_9NEOP|nr:hypothetical protein PR048_021239 [Dryococelus australis]